MTIFHIEVPTHWNYFLCLEDDIEHLSRWIEFSKENESVYSIELARLLMTASAEADVIAKALCKAINPRSKADSIGAYQVQLLAAIPMLPSAEVLIPRYGKTFHPWSNWATAKLSPDWWMGNNKVKHQRAEHFREASLKNVLNAVAALLVLLLLYYRSTQHSIRPLPRLFLPRTFATRQGDELLLLLPDGTNVPWG